jgi:hypothetical protein
VHPVPGTPSCVFPGPCDGSVEERQDPINALAFVHVDVHVHVHVHERDGEGPRGLLLTFSRFAASLHRVFGPGGFPRMSSVIKKRRKKMRKHKYEKMRKKMRHERRKRGK